MYWKCILLVHHSQRQIRIDYGTFNTPLLVVYILWLGVIVSSQSVSAFSLMLPR